MTAAASLRLLADWCEAHGVETAYSATLYDSPVRVLVALNELCRVAPEATACKPWMSDGQRTCLWRGTVDGVIVEAVEYLPLSTEPAKET